MAKKKTTAKSKKDTSKSKKSRASKKQDKSILKTLLKWTFVAGLWGLIFLTGIVAWYSKDLPDITKEATFERKNSIIVKAADGTEVARYGELQGKMLGPDDFPPHLVNAVLAIEDRRFYYHFGVDPVGFFRAMFVNVREGGFVQGGSTITQQLAKNLFLSKDRKIERKIREAILAVWLETRLTKDEIISAYLNRVYFGGGTYGVDAASHYYFNKEVKDLTLQESAMLAGMLKAPSHYSPKYRPKAAKARADIVIKSMKRAGFIDEKDDPNTDTTQGPPEPPKKPGGPSNNERFYADWIVDQLEKVTGIPNEDIIVETTLDLELQHAAQAALIKAVETYGEEKHFSQGAVVMMRPNGEVVALVGGTDYNDSQFNRATQARRQPGSSFKPIVYLTALEQGWKVNSYVNDAPLSGKYRPQNFGNKYYGPVPLAKALMLSLNTVAVQLINSVGPENVEAMAHSMGIKSELMPTPSLALGSSGVAPFEMATVYATIANGGVKIEPYGILRTTNTKGELYYERPSEDKINKKDRVASARSINDLSLMMRRVVESGTGTGARLSVPSAGKTGTTNESRDAWFAGFTTELVGVVWIGNDDNTAMKRVTGGSYPASIWREIMTSAIGRYKPIYYGGFNPFSGFEGLMDRLFNSDGTIYDEDEGSRGGWFSDLRRGSSSGRDLGWRDRQERSRTQGWEQDNNRRPQQRQPSYRQPQSNNGNRQKERHERERTYND